MATSIPWQHEEFQTRIDQRQAEINRNFEEIKEMLHFLIRKKEERTILVKIKFKIYPITTEVLDKVFSPCGILESVVELGPGGEYHSEVCFQNEESAIKALEWYNGRCVYDRCCELELFQASQVRDRSNPVEVPTQEVEDVSEISTNPEIGKSQSQFEEIPIKGDGIRTVQDSPRSFVQKFEMFSDFGVGDSEAEMVEAEQETMSPSPAIDRQPIDDGDRDELQNQQSTFKVNHKPSELIIYGGEINGLAELVRLLIELMEIRLGNSRTDSLECVRIFSAHKVFDKTPNRVVQISDISAQLRSENLVSSNQNWLFDPGGVDSQGSKVQFLQNFLLSDGLLRKSVICCDVRYPGASVALDEHVVSQGTLVFDPGGRSLKSCGYFFGVQKAGLGIRDANQEPPVLPFDRGKGGFEAILGSIKVGLNRRLINYWLDLSHAIFLIRDSQRSWDENFTFGPGGIQGTLLIGIQFYQACGLIITATIMIYLGQIMANKWR